MRSSSVTPQPVDTSRLVDELRVFESILRLAAEAHQALPDEAREVLDRKAGPCERWSLVHLYAGMSADAIAGLQRFTTQLLLMAGAEPVSSPRHPDLQLVSQAGGCPLPGR